MNFCEGYHFRKARETVRLLKIRTLMMEEVTDKDYRVCRVCMEPETDIKFASVFDENNNEKAEIIFKSFGVTVRLSHSHVFPNLISFFYQLFAENDVPAVVCDDCSSLIQIIGNMRQSCVFANENYFKKLRKLLDDQDHNRSERETESSFELVQPMVQPEQEESSLLSDLSSDKPQLTLSDLPPFVTWQKLHKIFQIYGKIKDIRLHYKTVKGQAMANHAHITFEDSESAMKALQDKVD